MKLSRLIQRSIDNSLQNSEHQITAVGMVGLIGFPLYYFIWRFVFEQPYENLPMRLFGSFLCLLLVFRDRWPYRLRRYLPYFWYFSIFYTLPFFFSFFMFMNHSSLISVMSMLVAVFLLVLVVDWIGLTMLSVAGIFFGWVAYHIATPDNLETVINWQFLPVYLFTVIAGSIFSYKSALIQQQKLHGMSAASGSIAHELRTPLLGIKSGAAGLKRYLPVLFDGYQQALDAGLPVKTIRSAQYQALLPILDRIESETHYANTIIDMLLMNVGKQHLDKQLFDVLSIQHCVERALGRYPFKSENEREKIHWDNRYDFEIKGAEILMVHVLFNLLKNALYFIARAEKGDIYIWCEHHGSRNTLHFKDTGEGIPPNVLPRLFNRFFSTTNVGTGIGLSFCKLVVESFGGHIECESEYGHYAEFILSFPDSAAVLTADDQSDGSLCAQ